MRKARLGKTCLKKIGTVICAAALIFSMQTQVLADSYVDICNDYEWEVLKLVNKERIKDGKEAISTFDKLQKASDVRTREIASIFDHTRPNGSSCFTVLKQKGISYMAAGENIASGQQTPEHVMDSWMNSPGHRSNILQSAFHHVGVGYGTTGICGNSWVQTFVGGCGVTDIRVNSDTQNYPVGSSIDSMNRYLIITCSSHGVSYAPVIGAMCSGYKSGQSGKQTVSVKYQGQKVKMLVSLGQGGSGSSSQDEEPVSDKPLVKPAKLTNFKVKKTDVNTCILTWKKTRCSGYEVWRANASGGQFKKIKTLSGASKNSYKVSLAQKRVGSKYYYKVRAYNKKGTKKKYGAFTAKKAIVKMAK